MRFCCINGCSSHGNDTRRSLFAIKGSRKYWINLIKQHQVLNESIQLFVCDLHFDSKDIKRYSNKTSLDKNATLIIGSKISNEIDNSYSSMDIINPFVDMPIEYCEHDESELELESEYRMLTSEVYTKLMQLIPQNEKYRHAIQKMEMVIKSKDAKIDELKRKQQRDCVDISHLSDEKRDVILCLINGRGNAKYSESVRRFSLMHHYHSVACYSSLRIFFNKHLPSKRTLQLWYSSVDGTPGICRDALNILREKADDYLVENNHQLHLTLIYDDMHIRKQLCYNPAENEFIGFPTYTSSKNNDEETPSLAYEALVYMVVGPDFKLPVAYELCNGLDAVDRAALTLQVIKEIEAVGAKVISLTGDGLAGNKSAAESLGARFDLDQPYFNSPTYPQQKIYIIFDAPHMIKLVRKHFSKNYIYHNNQLVDWNLLEALVQKQSLDNFNLCNKLKKLHIEWHQKPMNVRLAVETISNSVANSLEQLRKDGYEQYKNSATTVEFLRYFNDGFDVLNFGDDKQSDSRYKKPLNNETADHIFQFAEKFKQFIVELEYRTPTKNQALWTSTVGMGFFGFYSNFISLWGIYKDFVLNGPLKTFYPFQFSQDHLETFFSIIRDCLGRNDNPNTVEFVSAFKKLLVCHPLLTSVDHNVISNATGILTVPAKNLKTSNPKVPNQINTLLMPEINLELSYEAVLLEEIEAMEPYEQHMCAYIALCVERKFIQNTKQHKNKCSTCVAVLFDHDINDDLLELNAISANEKSQPSSSTLKLIIFANAIMKIVFDLDQQGHNFDAVQKVIANNIDIDDLYDDFDLKHNEQNELRQSCDHKKQFVDLLVKTYMQMKSQKIGKKITDAERGELIRHKRKRAVILKGQ